MTKRQAVEWCFHEGLSSEFAYDHLHEKYPEITIDWIEEVYKDMYDSEL